MYPSSNNNGFNPQRTTFSGTCYNESNHSNDPQDHYHHTPSSSSCSYLFPSPIYIPFPLEDEAVFCDFFRQQQFFPNGYNYENDLILPQEMTKNGESPMGECSNNNGQVVMIDGDDDHCDFNTRVKHQSGSPGKRASKRDRHSKINTARGPRDRRMRLSLDVAKKLFGLQDLLGFDKASKTVDWLLTKSKTAILELLADQSCNFMDVSNSASSSSECEVLSGTGDQSVVKTGDDQETTKNKAKYSSGIIKKQKERITRVVRRCADFHHPAAKASRERARQRARERTILKKNNKQISGGQDPKVQPCFLHQPMDQDINNLRSWIAIDESQHQSIGQFNQISSNFEFKQGFVGDNSSLLMTGNWSPSYLFNIQQNSGRTHEMIGKAWEGNNN